MDHIKFTNQKLSIDDVSELVMSPSFEEVYVLSPTNHIVDSQVYEARKEMALKVLAEVCHEIRKHWQSVGNIAIYHRLGTVPVGEAGVIIAVSFHQRPEHAKKAAEWCSDQLKKLVPIWKKEIYVDELLGSKNNEDSPDFIPKRKRSRVNIEQEVVIPHIPPHLIQIKASNKEIDRRIEAFINAKKNGLNFRNIADLRSGDRASEITYTGIDSAVRKPTDSKGCLQVNSAVNTSYHRDQSSSEHLAKYIPPNGVEERLENTELSFKTPVPKDIYKRIKILEDRMLHLESISPVYIQFWDKTQSIKKKKKYGIEDIDSLIRELERDI